MTNTNNKTEKRESREVEIKIMNPIKRELKINELAQKYIELKNQFIKGLMKLAEKGSRKSSVVDEVSKVVERYLVGMNRNGFKETLNSEFVQDSIISGIRIISGFTNYGTDTMVFTTTMTTENRRCDDDIFGVITEIKLSKELYSIMLKMEKIQDEMSYYKSLGLW